MTLLQTQNTEQNFEYKSTSTLCWVLSAPQSRCSLFVCYCSWCVTWLTNTTSATWRSVRGTFKASNMRIQGSRTNIRTQAHRWVLKNTSFISCCTKAVRVESKCWCWWSYYNSNNWEWSCGLRGLCVGPRLASASLDIWRTRPAKFVAPDVAAALTLARSPTPDLYPALAALHMWAQPHAVEKTHLHRHARNCMYTHMSVCMQRKLKHTHMDSHNPTLAHA